MPKRGGKRKKSRTHKETSEQEETSTGQKIPKSFIIKRGKVPNAIKDIVGDMREVMYPNTAMKLKESDKAKLKDYVKSAGGYEVTHMMIFSATEKNNYMRLVKLPEGPTLTFNILNHASHKDVLNSQKKGRSFSRTLANPLLIVSGFGQCTRTDLSEVEQHQRTKNYSLMKIMLQNLFPPLDFAKAKIHNSKKVVLFNLDQETDTIEFRYYGIKVNQAGLNKNIKNIMSSKKVPNLSKFDDIADFILRDQDPQSENEDDGLEDDTRSQTSAGASLSNKMSIKLYEIGPRLKLQLIKIEEDILKGNVVYHRLVKKSKQEIEQNRLKIKDKIKKKEQAKKEMQEILSKKEQEKLKKKELKKKFLEDKQKAAGPGGIVDVEDDEEGESDDDARFGEEYEMEMMKKNEPKINYSSLRKPDINEYEEVKHQNKKVKRGAYDLQTGEFVEEVQEDGDDDDGFGNPYIGKKNRSLAEDDEDDDDEEEGGYKGGKLDDDDLDDEIDINDLPDYDGEDY